MKPLLFLSAIVLFLSYCTGESHKANTGHNHFSAGTDTEATPAAHKDPGSTLTLNNGQKWKLDEPTRENIGELKAIVDKAASQQAPDYQQVAADLQASTDKLIGECRMSGPDHDALHVWLQGYMPALKELHSTNKSIQKNAFATIHSEVEQFGKFFE